LPFIFSPNATPVTSCHCAAMVLEGMMMLYSASPKCAGVDLPRSGLSTQAKSWAMMRRVGTPFTTAATMSRCDGPTQSDLRQP
jgi:hypothetical protein